jgi:hypothetical protein
MSIFSMSISNVSRAKGASSIASLSYIVARPMLNERTGQRTPDYGRQERVEHVATLLPEGAPQAWRDPEVLFNSIETFEKHANARPAKKIMVALPREMDRQTQIEAVEQFINENLVARGFAATYAIHTDQAEHNPHAHILIPNRPVDAKSGDWVKVKTRRHYALDENGERIPIIDPDTGKQKLGKRNRRLWKTELVKANPLDQPEVVRNLREAWANTANRYLDESDHIDHRSLKDQGIDRIPQIHLGYAAVEMDKRGEHSDRAQLAKQIKQSNKELAAIKEETNRLDAIAAKISQSIENGRILLRSAIDHVLSDERLYKVRDFIDRLKDIGISVKTHAKDWLYRLEQGPDAGAEATGADLGAEYSRDGVEARLRSQGERLAQFYDPQAVNALEGQISAIESDQLLPAARAQLAELDSQVRQAVYPVIQAQREAETAGIFKRGKARHHAEEAAGQAQAQLAHLVPWWSGQVTPDTANSAPESIHNQAQQMMQAEAAEGLEGLKSDLDAQNIYKDAHEHVETLNRIERYKKWGIFDKPDLRGLKKPTSVPPTPSRQHTQANQQHHGRSR